MGKTKWVLALCLGAWVGSAGAETPSDLGAEFQQIFLQGSVEAFEQEFVHNVQSRHSDLFTRMVDEDRQGRELYRELYAKLDGATMKASDDLDRLRSEHTKELAEALRLDLDTQALHYFREDIKGSSEVKVDYKLSTFVAVANTVYWVEEPAGWISEKRVAHAVKFQIAVNASEITFCLGTGDEPIQCKPFGLAPEGIMAGPDNAGESHAEPNTGAEGVFPVSRASLQKSASRF